MRNIAKTSRAFTIVELIVAISITVIMLFLINQLFVVTSNSVSLGVALSDVIGTGRALSDQLERDAVVMAKPEDGTSTGGNGLMVIVMQKMTAPYYEPGFKEGTRTVGTSQLMFLMERTGSSSKAGLIPIAPRGNDTYSPPLLTHTASVTTCRVWYGHVEKTLGNGADGGALGAAGRNRVCTNWMLGRHLLFLVDNPRDINGLAPPAGRYTVAVDNAATPTTSPAYFAIARADGAWADAGITGIAHPTGVAPKLFHGLTDIANCAVKSPSTVSPASLLGGDRATQGSGSDARTLYAWDDFSMTTRFPNATYQDRALACMFLDTQRMRANPFPSLDVDNNGTTSQAELDNPFPAGMIAQAHPIMADNISDFIVEIAGDYEDTGNDSIEDGTVDTASGEIKWYGMETNAATGTFEFPTSMPSWIDPALNPKVAAVPGGGVAFVFRHDYPKHWPYLVRIRYRVQDKRGDLLGDRSPENENALPLPPESGGKTNVGRWFEQIIYVRRE